MSAERELVKGLVLAACILAFNAVLLVFPQVLQ